MVENFKDTWCMDLNEFADLKHLTDFDEFTDLDASSSNSFGFYTLVNQALFCYVRSNEYSSFSLFPDASRAVALALRELNFNSKLKVLNSMLEIHGDKPKDSNHWWPIFMKCVTSILIQDVNKSFILNLIYNPDYRIQVNF